MAGISSARTHARRTKVRTGSVVTAAILVAGGWMGLSVGAHAGGPVPASYTVSLVTINGKAPEPAPAVTAIPAATPATFVVHFTNTGVPGDVLREVSIVVPQSFTVGTSSSTGTVSSWGSTVNGKTVTATGIPGELPGGSVDLKFTATPATPGTFPFLTSAKGVIGQASVLSTYKNQGSDPQVTVGVASVVTCANGAPCDSTPLTFGDTTSQVTTMGSGTDTLTTDVGPQVPKPSCRGGTPLGEASRYNNTNKDRTVTAETFGKVPPSVAPAEDEGVDEQETADNDDDMGANPRFAVCYSSKTPFKTAANAPATTTTGILPACSTVPPSPTQPCTYFIGATDTGGRVHLRINGQSGDPIWLPIFANG